MLGDSAIVKGWGTGEYTEYVEEAASTLRSWWQVG